VLYNRFDGRYGKDTFHIPWDKQVTKPPLSRPDAAFRRFQIVHALYLSAFTVVMLVSRNVLSRIDASWGRWLFALAPVALLALWAFEFGRMIKASDERQQALYLRALAIGFGIVLLAATLWDVLVRLGGGPTVPVFLLLPASVLVYGIVHARLARDA
jgi:hypothetical protein